MARLVNYKFPIPDVIDPPDRICLLIEVPNNETHISNLFGAIQTLTQGFSWEDDDAHSAKELAQVWRDVFSKIRFVDCECPPQMPTVAEMGIDMSVCEQLRFQNGKLQGLCCGVWEDIPGQSNAPGDGPQPGGGTPQPPAGGCIDYKFGILAGLSYMVPTPVNTGDVLTLSGLNGATTDVAPVGLWLCPNGTTFFAGLCTGPEKFDSTALAPAIPIGVPLYQVATNYYDTRMPWTVPGGVVNGVVAIVMNYPAGGTYGGSITGNLNVCNNQAARWSKTWDFALETGPWAPESDSLITDGAVWSPGVGWTYQDQILPGGSYERITAIQLDPIVFAMDTLDFEFDRVLGTRDSTATSGQNLVLNTSVVDSVTWGALTFGSNLHYGWPTPTAITSRIAVVLGCANNNTGPTFDGSCTIRSATITGHGANPFA